MSDHKFDPDIGIDLSSFVGQKVNPTTLETIKQTMLDTLEKHPGVEEPKFTYCDTLWKRMSLKEKLKWFAYNRFPFRSRGDLERQLLTALDERERLYWRLSNPGKDPCDYPHHFNLPNHLQPNPKTIVVMDVTLNLAQPIEFVTCDLELDSNGDIKVR